MASVVRDIVVAMPTKRSSQRSMTKDAAKYNVGTRVDAMFGGREGGLLFPGVISAVHDNGTYNVIYDDGDVETYVPADLILPEEVEVKRKRRKRTSCKHCGRSDHTRKTSKLCPHNPKFVTSLAEQQQAAAEVTAAEQQSTSRYCRIPAAVITTPVLPMCLPTDPSAYTPGRPFFVDVSDTSIDYKPMEVPENERHGANFRLPSPGPVTKEPACVCKYLSEIFIPDAFIELLHTKTLEYVAYHAGVSKKKFNISRGDIVQFLAIIFYMGIVRLPARRDYWKEADDIFAQHPVCVARGMTRDKFDFIWRHFYAVTPSATPDAGTAQDDDDDIHKPESQLDGVESDDEPDLVTEQEWCRKAAPFLNLLNKVSKIACKWPSFKMSIDEMIARFKGRSRETYRMKTKPIKCGYKFFSICDASSGYIWHMVPHGRVSNTTGIIAMFKSLVETLPYRDDKKYVVGADNYFTYPGVLTGCRDLGVGVVGTARARPGWPPLPISSVEDNRFNTLYSMRSKDNYLTMRWVDNNVVTMVTTIHNPTDTKTCNRRKPRRTATNSSHVDAVWGQHYRCMIKVWPHMRFVVDSYYLFFRLILINALFISLLFVVDSKGRGRLQPLDAGGRSGRPIHRVLPATNEVQENVVPNNVAFAKLSTHQRVCGPEKHLW